MKWIHVLPALAVTTLFATHASADDDQQLIQHGAYVARLGDCVACHTAPKGKPFAGGLGIESGLGTIFSTNITPDPEHGIGSYTEQEFADAVRKGVRKDGAHLYPAMPYPSYKNISDDDMHALYVYLMKGVKPVSEQTPETSLSFPFSQRWGMMFWNMVFDSSQVPAKSPDAEDPVKRGAYLVEGLGHCGSCHTPRGIAMQEKAYDSSSDDYLSGADLNGWWAPSLRAGKGIDHGISSWSTDEIVDYLGKGRNDRAAVGGEMTSVVENSTSHMTDDDLHAIAAFLQSLKPTDNGIALKDQQEAQKTTDKLTAARDLTAGERLYIDNCAACHLVDGKGASNMFPQLDGGELVTADNATGLIHTILQGAKTPSVERAPSINVMPGFSERLSDKETAELATFLRQAWQNNAAAVSASDVAKVRESIEKK